MKEKSLFNFTKSTLIITIIFLILPFVFFYFLTKNLGGSFGLAEISSSLMFTIFSIGFLLWIKSLMVTRPYLGLIVGLSGLFVFVYGLTHLYFGPNTTIFIIIGCLISIIYIGVFFFRYKNQTFKSEELG